jgi:hypothetical protein
VFVENPQPILSPEPCLTTGSSACDEWGIYDPERAGIAAVVRRVASPDPSSPGPAPTEPGVGSLPIPD